MSGLRSRVRAVQMAAAGCYLAFAACSGGAPDGTLSHPGSVTYEPLVADDGRNRPASEPAPVQKAAPTTWSESDVAKPVGPVSRDPKQELYTWIDLTDPATHQNSSSTSKKPAAAKASPQPPHGGQQPMSSRTPKAPLCQAPRHCVHDRPKPATPVKGWQCFVLSMGDDYLPYSFCYRTKPMCRAMRKVYMPRGVSASLCQPESAAWCLRVWHPVHENEELWCARTHKECEFHLVSTSLKHSEYKPLDFKCKQRD